MPNNVQQHIYIHQNLNRNELREAVIQNSTTDTRPHPNIGEDLGLIYFDSDIKRLMVWDGENWKVVKYYDDRDLNSNDSIKLQNIWADSEDLVSITQSSAQAPNSLVEYHSDVEINYLPGTLDFTSNSLQEIVLPRKFSNGDEIPDFFDPTLKDNNGNVIPRIDNGKERWRLVEQELEDYSISYRVRFINEVPPYSVNRPLFLTYYEYIGDKLEVSIVGGVINKQVYNASGGNQLPTTYEINLLPGLTTEQQVLDISLNGVELFPDSYSIITGSINNKLVIDTNYLGYSIDTTSPEDYISVNFISE